MYDPLGEQDQVLFPGLNGGANYGGASFDSSQNLLFVNTMDVGGLFHMAKRREGAAIPYAFAPRNMSSSPTRTVILASGRRGALFLRWI